MAKAKIEDIAPEELQGALVEVQQQAAVAAAIPVNDPERTNLIREQLVTRAESSARAQQAPKLKCSSCGATFVTKEAAELHVEGFHPEAPAEKAAGPAEAIAVKVVKDEKPSSDTAKVEKVPAKDAKK